MTATLDKLDSLHPAVTAADYAIAALGRDGAMLAMIALRAEWLTPDEARRLRPLAQGIAQLLEIPLPSHRDND